jgi:hypothetical protein
MIYDAVADFPARLRACLDEADPDAALVRLRNDFRLLAELPRVSLPPPYADQTQPHPLIGLAISLVAGALIRTGRAADARTFINEAADLFNPENRVYVRGSTFGVLVGAFPFLFVPSIVASIALGDGKSAVEAVVRFCQSMQKSELTASCQRRTRQDDWFESNPMVRDLLNHHAIEPYGPFCFDHRWMLERQEEILRRGPLDRRLEATYEFNELLLENALVIEQPARGLALIEDGFNSLGPDSSGPVSGHLAFNAVCVLAALGRFDEALAAAYAMARHGYGLLARFDLAAVAERMPWWTALMRQNKWLGPLAATEAYQSFLQNEVASRPFDVSDPAFNPLCAVRDGALGGKAKQRCWLSREPISPGEPVVRIRRLFGHASDGEFDIIKKDAFAASGWATARQEFETDTVPVRLLFPDTRTHAEGSRIWRTAAIFAFHYDVARNPDAFDLDRAVALIADRGPNPIRFEWVRGKDDVAPAFDPMVNDVGHGDAVNFAWRLLKAGCGRDIFRRVANLPQEKADKVFAMLATFDRNDCRGASAEYFGLPDLPKMMERAFRKRPSLEDHIAAADFASAQPRFRRGLTAAMRAYALHLYSNNRPAADWFLQGLEHFSGARCCRLLTFLIHHPEDDWVLATMIERGWLPQRFGRDDAYSNALSFYYRTVLFNRMLHAPEQLENWLAPGWPGSRMTRSKDRETVRLVEQWRKKPRRSHGRPSR